MEVKHRSGEMDKRIWKVEALIKINPDVSFKELLRETKYHESTLKAILRNLKYDSAISKNF